MPDTFEKLIADVRKVRAPLSICPSAQQNIDINRVLNEIIDNEVNRADYKKITEALLFTPLSYEEAVTSLRTIMNRQYF